MNNKNQNIEYKRIWQDDNLKSVCAFSVPVCRRHQMLMVQVVQPYNLTSSCGNLLKNKGDNLTTIQAKNLTSLMSQITDFCAQWRTLSEIAEHVQRSRQYLRGEVIPQMFDVLERKYDSPTHPKQQYRAKR